MTGRRPTRQRAAIAALLEHVDEFASARQIHALLARAGDTVGLATVYRTLHAMGEDGDCDVLRPASGDATLYRRCARREHHHHLVCRDCGRTVEIAAEEVEAWARLTGDDAGFSEVEHSVEMVGTCGPCRRA